MIAGIGQIISGLTLIVVLSGCGSGRRWEGTWTGVLGIQKQPGVLDPIANSQNKVELRILGNGSFLLLTESVAKSGVLRAEGEVASLEVEEVLERPVEPSLKKNFDEITIRRIDENTILFEDGDLMIPGPNGIKPAKVTLKRQTQPAETG
ncbi:MAG: hypothetical protein WAO58_02565 [Fimbriimonadaceae bacterium]